MSNEIVQLTDVDGVVTLVLDDPAHSANTMSTDFLASLDAAVGRLESYDGDLRGVVITSAKPTFLAGGDLRFLIRATSEQAADVAAISAGFLGILRRLERLQAPVVAALNGSALGGGLELALACNHRIAVKGSRARFGLPEVTLGLLPGSGGIVRTVRMLGLRQALDTVLLDGKSYGPEDAYELGLVSELVTSPEDLLPTAVAWCRQNRDAVQPWDRPGFHIPGGDPSDPDFIAALPAMTAGLKRRLRGAPIQAPVNILNAAVESTYVDFDRAFEIETRYFVDLVVGQQSKNMIQAFFFDMQEIRSGSSRPAVQPPYSASRVAVLGAGMMGAGIAYQCAVSGLDVMLKDVTVEQAEAGKDYARRLVSKAVSRGRMTQAQADRLLDRITPTQDAAELTGCDVVVEAVFEDPSLKQQVLREAVAHVRPDALLGSNTSSLPITELAAGVTRPEDFIGLHFFSPVDRMQLLEIVVGGRTSEATLARAFDFGLQIGRLPIIVNDARGFFTSRVITAFSNEAVAMVGEGVDAASIDRAAEAVGYPVGPLQLIDELTLTLPRKLRVEAQVAAERDGERWVPHPCDAVLDEMIDRYGRTGRAQGGGFCEYEDGRRVRFWPGLKEYFASHNADVPYDDIRDRMLFAEVLESARCFEEGVISSFADANVGSLLGIGFPKWTGGTAQFIDQYPGGTTGFVARCKELAERYGDRFVPPTSLLQTAERGEAFRRGLQ